MVLLHYAALAHSVDRPGYASNQYSQACRCWHEVELCRLSRAEGASGMAGYHRGRGEEEKGGQAERAEEATKEVVVLDRGSAADLALVGGIFPVL